MVVLTGEYARFFNGYLGWFDGNPVNLNRLTPKIEAEKIVKMAGGIDQLRSNAQNAYKEGEFQWATQLCDYLLAIDENDNEIIKLKAKSLMEIAKTMANATGRNYMNSYALQLLEGSGN